MNDNRLPKATPKVPENLKFYKVCALTQNILIGTISKLNNRKIGFKSITENIDTTTSGGKLIFHIFGALAEFERDIIKERTNAGLQAARARGRLGGRPKQKHLMLQRK